MNIPPFAEPPKVSPDSLVGKHVNPTMSFFLEKALADVKKLNAGIERGIRERRELVEGGILKVATVALVLFCAGCSVSSSVEDAQNVRKQFPGAEIAAIPGSTIKWVIRDTNGAVHFAKWSKGNNIESVKLLESK